MNAEVHCTQELLLQADFDGELDLAQSAALETHRANCSVCAQSLLRLQRSRELLRDARPFVAPDALRARVRQQLASKANSAAMSTRSNVMRKFRYLISGAGVGALAAGVLAFLL